MIWTAYKMFIDGHWSPKRLENNNNFSILGFNNLIVNYFPALTTVSRSISVGLICLPGTCWWDRVSAGSHSRHIWARDRRSTNRWRRKHRTTIRRHSVQFDIRNTLYLYNIIIIIIMYLYTKYTSVTNKIIQTHVQNNLVFFHNFTF